MAVLISTVQEGSETHKKMSNKALSPRSKPTLMEKLEAHFHEKREVVRKQRLQGMTPEQNIGGLLVLREMHGGRLFEECQHNMMRLSGPLDVHKLIASKILTLVDTAFIIEREVMVHHQQEGIREFPTQVFPIRERLFHLETIVVMGCALAEKTPGSPDFKQWVG